MEAIGLADKYRGLHPLTGLKAPWVDLSVRDSRGVIGAPVMATA